MSQYKKNNVLPTQKIMNFMVFFYFSNVKNLKGNISRLIAFFSSMNVFFKYPERRSSIRFINN